MSRITLTPELQYEYQHLFATCAIRLERVAEVEERVDAIMADRDRYWTVGQRLNIPWFVVAALHEVDAGRDFTVHLHNGDPLTERTRHLPDGRPAEGGPPFTWEDSALDALMLRGIDAWDDWSIAGTLYKLEEYNGWGYRLYHAHVLSPYLWSFSNHYVSGKYVADGTWSDTAVSNQAGCAVLMRRLAEVMSLVSPGAVPRIRFSRKAKVVEVEALQRYLNTLPGVFVRVDGVAGRRTSDAFSRATGRYLKGDPKARGRK